MMVPTCPDSIGCIKCLFEHFISVANQAQSRKEEITHRSLYYKQVNASRGGSIIVLTIRVNLPHNTTLDNPLNQLLITIHQCTFLHHTITQQPDAHLLTELSATNDATNHIDNPI